MLILANFDHTLRKSAIAAVASAVVIASMGVFAAGSSACQKTEGTARVTCAGSCPSTKRPSCYVKHRDMGSSDAWNKTGQPGIDKNLSNQEYACYCDT